MKYYYVYIMASKYHGTLYIGYTDDLLSRVYAHKNDFVDGFTKRYGTHLLVHYEICESKEGALWREKALKVWHRAWKIRLIEETNPEWKDLYDELTR
jgi:putative endonuclease